MSRQRRFATITSPLSLRRYHKVGLYGRFKASIPRAAIVSATATREALDAFQPMLASYDVSKRRIVIALSESGQALLWLDRAYPVRIRRKMCQTGTILLNVDRREAFLAALDVDAPATILAPTTA